MKTRIAISLEILIVFAIFVALRLWLGPLNLVRWEVRNLGWTYSLMIVFIAVTLLVMLLSRRPWAEYGVSTANWPANHEIGMRAFLVSMVPYVLGWSGSKWLKLDPNQLAGGAWIALWSLVALALMVWALNRPVVVKSGRKNLIVTGVLLLVPILTALFMGKLSLVVVSTVIWQLIFSGFGEELTFRGYFQSRANQAYGRPWKLFGIEFGPGLLIASSLFGMWHAFNTFDPAVGLSSMAWGWMLSTFVGGLFFGVIREKTGALLAPSIAHGLPDAVGEGLMKLFTWM